MKHLLIASCCLLAFSAVAEKQSFDRYQSILDRQMFGPLPPDFDPNKLPSEVQRSSAASDKELTQEQEKLKSAIHFSVLDVRPNGDVLVGFTDNSDPKVPRNYFLKVGESRDGWTVKEADQDAATMTIVKDEVEVSLSLGGNSAQGAGTTARSGGNAPAASAGSSLLGGGSLRARRLQRRQAEAAAQEKAAAASAAKEAERQAQAEADRAQREAERAEQRQQLMAIQEELRRVREAKAAETKASESAEASDGAKEGAGGNADNQNQ